MKQYSYFISEAPRIRCHVSYRVDSNDDFIMSAGKGRSRFTGQKATEHHRQPTSLCQIDGCHNGGYGLSLLQVLEARSAVVYKE